MLYLTRGGIVLLLWIAWLVYWRLSAAGVKPAARRESAWSRTSYIIPIVIASILLSIPPIPGGGFLFSRFLPPGIDGYWLGVMLIAADKEKIREAVNDWIRHSGAFDGVIDFDLVARDPNRPTHILAKYDSGDHLHPQDDGYKAMADSIDLKLLTTQP